MSYLNALSTLPWDWVLLGGGLGGALNAVSSSNLRLFPAWARDTRGVNGGRVIRVGLLVSSTVGAATSLGLIWSLREMATFEAVIKVGEQGEVAAMRSQRLQEWW